MIEIVTYNGHIINDGSVYSAQALFSDSFFKRTSKPILAKRLDRHPVYQRLERVGTKIAVRLSILSTETTVSDKLDELNGWFAIGTDADLVLSFEGVLRKVRGVVESVTPQDRAPNRFTVVLRMPDPRWLSNRTILYDNGGVSCNGENLITDSIRTAGDEGDGMDVMAGGSTGIWPASTNMCTNSSLDTNTIGWGTLSSVGSPSRSTLEVLFSTFSVRVTAQAGTNTHLTFESGGVGIGSEFTAGKWYSASCWIYIGSGWTAAGGSDIQIKPFRMDSDTSSVERIDGIVANENSWQYMQCFWYQDVTANGGVRWNNPVNPSGLKVYYVEGLMIEEFDERASIIAGPHITTDGAVDDHTYALCTADASSYATSQSWFMARVRVMWTQGIWNNDTTRKHTVFGWWDSATSYIHCYYQESAGGQGSWVLERMNDGVVDTVSVVNGATRGQLESDPDFRSVCAAWENGLVRLSIQGTAFDETVTVTNGIPAVTNPYVEIGSIEEDDQLCGDIVWAAAGSGVLTDADVLTLHGFGDTLPSSYPAAANEFFTWDASDATAGDSITEFSLYQNGNVDYEQAVLTLKPITQKAAADGPTHSRDIALANRVARSFPNYAVDITDGGMDTAAIVTAGNAQADGDDFRVLVDGVEVPRWFGEDAGTNDFDQTGTTVWVNIDLEPSKTGVLLTAASDSDTSFVFDIGSLAGWPDDGFFVIGTECVRYASRTDTTASGCTRGERGTTAAAHSTDVVAYWAQRRVQLMYGHSAATAPDARADRKPMIDLAVSTNELLHWDNATGVFDADNTRRSMQWNRVLREVEAGQNRFALSDNQVGGGNDPMAWRYRRDGAVPGEIAGNTFAIVLPPGTGEDGSGDVVEFDGGTDFSTRVRCFGIDTIGNRRFLGGYEPDDYEAPSTITLPSVGDDMVAIEFVGSVGRVVGTPALGSSGIDGGGGIAEIVLTGSVRQAFVVPSSKDIGSGSIFYVYAYLQSGRASPALPWSTTVTVTARIQKEDPDNLGQYFTVAESAVSPVWSEAGPGFVGAQFQQIPFLFSPKVPVIPGDNLVLQIEYTSLDSGTTDVEVQWGGSVMSYNDRPTVQDFYLVSDDLDQDGIVGLPSDTGESIDQITLYMNADGVPVMVLGVEQSDAYYIDGVIENVTTGQTVGLEALVAIDDELQVNMDTGAVMNVTQDLGIANLATFSDNDDLLTLVPGKNEMTYTEAGLVSISINVTYNHVWQ